MLRVELLRIDGYRVILAVDLVFYAALRHFIGGEVLHRLLLSYDSQVFCARDRLLFD
jgi:hypothetical protein